MTPTRPFEMYQSYFLVIGLIMLFSYIIFGHGVYRVFFWSHLVISLGFIAYIPYSKMFRILTDSLNQNFAKDKAGQCVKPLDNVSPWKISWKSRADWDDEL